MNRYLVLLPALALAACTATPDKPNVQTAPEPSPPVAPAAPPAASAETGPHQPAAPYWSIEVAPATGPKTAAKLLAQVKDAPYARAEKRKSGQIVRVGAWATKDEADAQLPEYRKVGKSARVLQVENPVDWVMPDGSTLPVKGAAPPVAAAGAMPEKMAPAVPAAAPTPLPEGVPADLRSAATDLDEAVRQRLRTGGAARKDGYTYAMDVAPLLLYAAQAGDQTYYLSLRTAAQALVSTSDDDPYARGFVHKRIKDKAKPDMAGAAEALWMARALWAGGKAFGRNEDRELALAILEGYAKNAYELQGVWLVRTDFNFASRAFAGLSVLSDYNPDFLSDAESAASKSAFKGFAERSYAVIERTHAPSGLLYPVIQPEVGATYPGLGVEVYAPNGVASLEQSCVAAEGSQRGLEKVARGVLDFAKAKAGKGGGLNAYYAAEDGAAQGAMPLPATGYACLSRLATGLADGDAVARFDAPLKNAMREARQAGDLGASGQLLLAVQARGAQRPS